MCTSDLSAKPARTARLLEDIAGPRRKDRQSRMRRWILESESWTVAQKAGRSAARIGLPTTRTGISTQSTKQTHNVRLRSIWYGEEGSTTEKTPSQSEMVLCMCVCVCVLTADQLQSRPVSDVNTPQFHGPRLKPVL